MDIRRCPIFLIAAAITTILSDSNINAVEQYGSKACTKRTIVRHYKDEGLVFKSREIPICCKGWKEFNETFCIKGSNFARYFPFRDIQYASAFLSNRKIKRSLHEECEAGSCSYEEVREHGYSREQICKMFKDMRCKDEGCRAGYNCETLNDHGCQKLSKYEVYCKACEAGTFGDSCVNNCNCSKEGFWKTECNKMNGTCYCEDGYTGPKCDEICDAGKYGMSCRNVCSCPNEGFWKTECSRNNGTCYCQDGYTGVNCDETLDITTQQIFQDQEPQGSTSQRYKINIIIATVTLGTLMVSMIIIITVVYKRKHGQQSGPTENNYAELSMMSQPLSQEYMYEDLRSRNNLEDPESMNQDQ